VQRRKSMTARASREKKTNSVGRFLYVPLAVFAASPLRCGLAPLSQVVVFCRRGFVVSIIAANCRELPQTVVSVRWSDPIN
jgi:hypothetical protein